MKLPPTLNDFLDKYISHVWVRRGIVIATFASLLTYAYLFLSSLDQVPDEVRTALLNAQENHLEHNHQEVLDHLTPFDRFEQYRDTRVYDTARQLKTNAETVVKRQNKIRSKYKEAMKHRVASDGPLSPSAIDEKLSALETELEELRQNHTNFLQKHPETAPPYSDTKKSMQAILLHRFIRRKNEGEPSFVRLYEYKVKVYTQLLDQCSNMVNRTPDTSYRNALNHLTSADNLLEDTLFKSRINQLLKKLRTKIADHFDRINQKSRKLLKKNKHKKALKVFQNNRNYFKNIDPWDRILNHRIDTLKKIKELMDS